jgi:hypothetical protein
MAAVINEVQSRHNPPPNGMTSCRSFTWSVKDFDEKRNNPQIPTTAPPTSKAGIGFTKRPAWESMFLLVTFVIAQYIA